MLQDQSKPWMISGFWLPNRAIPETDREIARMARTRQTFQDLETFLDSKVLPNGLRPLSSGSVGKIAWIVHSFFRPREPASDSPPPGTNACGVTKSNSVRAADFWPVIFAARSGFYRHSESFSESFFLEFVTSGGWDRTSDTRLMKPLL